MAIPHKIIWPTTLTNVTPHQQEQWSNACHSRIAILTGGPGTGKTHVVARVIHQLLSSHAVTIDSIAACAPSGKAAVRITEQLTKAGLPIEGMTIHRLLGVQRNGRDGNGWAFMFNKSNRLPLRVVVVDESSMIETTLFAQLLEALPNNAHLLIVGDPNQLPPVGNGAPLRDLLSRIKGLPRAHLTETIRNGGAILDACSIIREGRRLTAPRRPITPGDVVNDNWLHIEQHNPTTIFGHVVNLVRNAPTHYDRTWDVQVVCARNENGPLNRNSLNQAIRSVCNPPAEESQADNPKTFRAGDKVICTSNVLLPPGEQISTPAGSLTETEFVANGELARVLSVEKDRTLLRCLYPQRDVVVLGASTVNTKFDFGYAITTHKSQGSEFPVVIMAIDEHAGLVAGREWYYTAFSRASKMLITVGELDVVNKHCRTQHLPKRKTFLFTEGKTQCKTSVTAR